MCVEITVKVMCSVSGLHSLVKGEETVCSTRVMTDPKSVASNHHHFIKPDTSVGQELRQGSAGQFFVFHFGIRGSMVPLSWRWAGGSDQLLSHVWYFSRDDRRLGSLGTVNQSTYMWPLQHGGLMLNLCGTSTLRDQVSQRTRLRVFYDHSLKVS